MTLRMEEAQGTGQTATTVDNDLCNTSQDLQSLQACRLGGSYRLSLFRFLEVLALPLRCLRHLH